jgi:hypothetical protein
MLTQARCRLFGFLLGSTLAGASVYYYILEEYKVSNELLTEDIYVCLSLQSFTQGGHWLSFPTVVGCADF